MSLFDKLCLGTPRGNWDPIALAFDCEDDINELTADPFIDWLSIMQVVQPLTHLHFELVNRPHSLDRHLGTEDPATRIWEGSMIRQAALEEYHPLVKTKPLELPFEGRYTAGQRAYRRDYRSLNPQIKAWLQIFTDPPLSRFRTIMKIYTHCI
eukprot:GHVH01003747.1.p1 GENE.GHVH01003747.1~~GHVH01003747.1.p1  ORF type:complete len:153 (+),score=10.10 GHVH01003747.1:898-1356(+)